MSQGAEQTRKLGGGGKRPTLGIMMPAISYKEKRDGSCR